MTMNNRKGAILFIKFYGARGSIPTPMTNSEYSNKLIEILKLANSNDINDENSIQDFISALPFYLQKSYGGNTACVYLNLDGTHVILDMGSGVRNLGLDLITKDFGVRSDELFIFLSHTHWDHIQGLPFFIPAFLEGNRLNFYSGVSKLKDRMEMQQYAQFFPISLNEMGAEFKFHEMEMHKSYQVTNFKVSSMRLNHPNGSYAYKICYKNKSIIYATDTEFNDQSINFIKESVDFFKNADILIFDTQYTSKESFEKLHWGHSSANTAIDVAVKSNVKKLILFHHEPNYNDKKLYEIYKEVIQYHNTVSKKLELAIQPAYEGLHIDL